MNWILIENIELEARQDNDKIGREFEWKVTKEILRRINKFNV